MLNGVVVHFMYKHFGFSEVKVDFWMQSIEETIGKAKKEVGEERARQYEEEGIVMGFESSRICAGIQVRLISSLILITTANN